MSYIAIGNFIQRFFQTPKVTAKDVLTFSDLGKDPPGLEWRKINDNIGVRGTALCKGTCNPASCMMTPL